MGKQHRKQSANLQHGFTLTELIVAMAMAVIVMGALYSTFKSQQDCPLHDGERYKNCRL
jgi:prepilin-type N-terminal cleavage/methylation domain-containing protein